MPFTQNESKTGASFFPPSAWSVLDLCLWPDLLLTWSCGPIAAPRRWTWRRRRWRRCRMTWRTDCPSSGGRGQVHMWAGAWRVDLCFVVVSVYLCGVLHHTCTHGREALVHHSKEAFHTFVNMEFVSFQFISPMSVSVDVFKQKILRSTSEGSNDSQKEECDACNIAAGSNKSISDFHWFFLNKKQNQASIWLRFTLEKLLRWWQLKTQGNKIIKQKSSVSTFCACW